MATPIKHDQLILDNFIAFNLDRYKDDPTMLPLFQNLILDEVNIINKSPDVGTPGNYLSIISSASRGFRGIQQGWTRGDLNDPNGFIVLNRANPANSIDDLATTYQVPGAYAYKAGADTLVALLVVKGDTPEGTKANTTATFKANYFYDSDDLSLIVDTNSTIVNIDTNNFYLTGAIPVVQFVLEKVIPPTFYGKLKFPVVTE